MRLQKRLIVQAIGHGALGFVVSEAITEISTRHGTPLVHGRLTRMKRLARKHPLAMVVWGTVCAPLGEEFVYRRLPSSFLDRQGKEGLQPVPMLLIALAFSLRHAGKDGIPVPQFLGSLNYWYLQRKHGYAYAVIAHSTRNLLGCGYYYQKWKQEEA